MLSDYLDTRFRVFDSQCTVPLDGKALSKKGKYLDLYFLWHREPCEMKFGLVAKRKCPNWNIVTDENIELNFKTDTIIFGLG